MDAKEALKKLGIGTLILVVLIALIAGISASFTVGAGGASFYSVTGIVLVAVLIAACIVLYKKSV